MNKKFFIPFFITILVVLLFYLKRLVIIKLYPPVCNFCIFMTFFLSLFAKETVIQKIAKAIDGKLSDSVRIYTRKLTYVWCIFTFFNFLISTATVFMPDKIWMVYNGFISYIFVGLLFGIEYIIRIVLKKKKIL